MKPGRELDRDTKETIGFSNILGEAWRALREGNKEQAISLARFVLHVDPKVRESYLLLAQTGSPLKRTPFLPTISNSEKNIGEANASFDRSEGLINHGPPPNAKPPSPRSMEAESLGSYGDETDSTALRKSTWMEFVLPATQPNPNVSTPEIGKKEPAWVNDSPDVGEIQLFTDVDSYRSSMLTQLEALEHNKGRGKRSRSKDIIKAEGERRSLVLHPRSLPHTDMEANNRPDGIINTIHMEKEEDNRKSGMWRRVRDFFLQAFSRTWLVPIVYLIPIAFAEIAIAGRTLFVGMGLHAAILVSLIALSARSNRLRLRRFLISISLLPIMRLVSLVLPRNEGSPILWYFFLSASVFSAALAVKQVLGFSYNRLGFVRSIKKADLLLPLGVLLISWLWFSVWETEWIEGILEGIAVLWPMLVLLFLNGFVEEFVYRGLVQQTALELMGPFGLYYIPVASSLLYIGHGSTAQFLFALLIGALFTRAVWRTGSLLGASVAHGLTNVFLLIVFPQLNLLSIF